MLNNLMREEITRKMVKVGRCVDILHGIVRTGRTNIITFLEKLFDKTLRENIRLENHLYVVFYVVRASKYAVISLKEESI